jgi:hypothetical protein
MAKVLSNTPKPFHSWSRIVTLSFLYLLSVEQAQTLALKLPGMPSVEQAQTLSFDWPSIECSSVAITDIPTSDRLGRFVRRWILNITDVIHYEPTFEICAVDEFNAFAMPRGAPPKLAYGKPLFEPMMLSPRTNWEAIMLLSHEIGHFVLHTEGFRARRKEMELEADEFSGYILAKIGIPEETLERLAKYGDYDIASVDHHGTPAERRDAAVKGWKKARIGLTYDAKYQPYLHDLRYWLENAKAPLAVIGAMGVGMISLFGLGSWLVRRMRLRNAARTRVFISYRRDDTAGIAGRIYDKLRQHVPASHIFMDVDAIAPGANFREAIQTSVAKCDVLLAIIGRSWISATDEHGARRLENIDDPVRVEISAALNASVRIVPVLVDKAAMPTEAELPDALSSVALCNAVEVRHSRFDSDVANLTKSLAMLRTR